MKRLIFILFMLSGCMQKQGVFYFKSWASQEIPFRPQGEISQEEAIKLKSYYSGYYVNSLLTKFEKYLVPYRLQNFDKKGNIIKE